MMGHGKTTKPFRPIATAILLCLQAAEAAPLDVQTGASVSIHDANPYSIIVDRNVFRLVPPPPPPEPDKGPPPDLPAVFLTGFMRTGSLSRALLAVQTDNPDQHGPKLIYYMALCEGEKREVGAGDKRGFVELVRIHAGEEGVDIINTGSAATLSTKDNGFKGAETATQAKLPTPLIRKPLVRRLPEGASAVTPSGAPAPAMENKPPAIPNPDIPPNQLAPQSNGGTIVAGAGTGTAAQK
jgi:hypothetical protein